MSIAARGDTIYALLPAVWKLLRLRWLIFYSGFRRAKLIRKIIWLVLGIFILGFVGFLFFLSWVFLRFLNSPELISVVGDPAPLLESIPVLLMGGVFLGIMLTSFGVMLQALYLAGDMDFLLTSPVPIRAVFISKLLQAILPNFALVSLLVLPVFFGLGLSQGYNFLYYPLVLVVLAALALAAAALSSLLVMFIVRIFPAKRVAEVLAFAGGISTFVCSQSGQFARWGEFSPDQADQMFTTLVSLNTPWSPLAWAGQGLVSLGEGRWIAAAGFLTLTLGASFLVFGFALTTAERLYYNGWASMRIVRRKKKAPRNGRAPGAGMAAVPMVSWFSRAVPSPVRAIVAKDFSLLRRDLRNMSQLITPLIFGIVYAVMLLRGGGETPAGRGEAPEWFMESLTIVMSYGNVAIALFVAWMMLWNLAGMGFSQEGKSYWILKTAPVSVFQLLASKFLVAFLPSTALSWVFLIILSIVQRSDPRLLLFTAPVVALIIAGNVGVGLAFGVINVKLDWEDPREMNKSSSCLGMLVMMVYLPFSLLFFFGPLAAAYLLQWPIIAGHLGGLLVGGLFSAVSSILPLWLVRDRVPVMGEA